MPNHNMKYKSGEDFKLVRDEKHENKYIDKVTSLAVGPSVSKIGFGFEDPHGGKIMETLTLTMPTTTIMDIVEIINQTLKDEKAKIGLSKEIDKNLTKINNY